MKIIIYNPRYILIVYFEVLGFLFLFPSTPYSWTTLDSSIIGSSLLPLLAGKHQWCWWTLWIGLLRSPTPSTPPQLSGGEVPPSHRLFRFQWLPVTIIRRLLTCFYALPLPPKSTHRRLLTPRLRWHHRHLTAHQSVTGPPPPMTIPPSPVIFPSQPSHSIANPRP